MLERELKEELGIKIKKFSLVGLVDNIYEEEDKEHHDINLIFHFIPAKITSQSKENHISFFFFLQKEIQKGKVYRLHYKGRS